MKILKTKQERKVKDEKEAQESYVQIVSKVNEFGKVSVTLDREDFKEDLLYPGLGFSSEDLKRKNRIVLEKLYKDGYKVNFEPVVVSCDNFGVVMTVKLKK